MGRESKVKNRRIRIVLYPEVFEIIPLKALADCQCRRLRLFFRSTRASSLCSTYTLPFPPYTALLAPVGCDSVTEISSTRRMSHVPWRLGWPSTYCFSMELFEREPARCFSNSSAQKGDPLTRVSTPRLLCPELRCGLHVGNTFLHGTNSHSRHRPRKLLLMREEDKEEYNKSLLIWDEKVQIIADWSTYYRTRKRR